MTNLEKFEEVFGIKLDPNEAQYTDFPCSCADDDFCDKYEADCDEPEGCPAKNFWSKEYVEKTNWAMDEVTYVKNDENATGTYGTKFVKEAIEAIDN